MKVLVLSNGEFKTQEITNELEDLQKIVGGYIEIPFLSELFFKNEIDIIINEEGKFIDGLKPEIAIIQNGTNRILDVIYGNAIFASHDEEGNTIELNNEQMQIVIEELATGIILTDKNTKKEFLMKVLFI